mgnify:FL=1
MTTEPKFVPKEAAEIQLAKDVSVLVRLIDCVAIWWREPPVTWKMEQNVW